MRALTIQLINKVLKKGIRFFNFSTMNVPEKSYSFLQHTFKY